MRDKQFIDFDNADELEEMPEDIKPMAKIREIVQRAREAKGDWNRMAEIAQSQLENRGQTIEDVHDCLNDIRNNDEIVQYFIVNSELNMSTGKVAAQVAHVANKIKLEADTVIILKAKEKDLLKLIEYGFYFTRDLGRTEVQSGSLTCVGLPPMKKSEAHNYVKRFRLY